jgi:hypothetical protein
MIKIENVNLEYLEEIEEIAKKSVPYMVANNHMIYYLCCTAFSKYSFVAIKDNKVIGYIFAFSDSYQKYIWIHQLAVIKEEQNRICTGYLIRNLAEVLIKENKIITLRFAIRKDNEASYRIAANFYRKSLYGIDYDTKSLGVDKKINNIFDMEIFEIVLKTTNR